MISNPLRFLIHWQRLFRLRFSDKTFLFLAATFVLPAAAALIFGLGLADATFLCFAEFCFGFAFFNLKYRLYGFFRLFPIFFGLPICGRLGFF